MEDFNDILNEQDMVFKKYSDLCSDEKDIEIEIKTRKVRECKPKSPRPVKIPKPEPEPTKVIFIKGPIILDFEEN